TGRRKRQTPGGPASGADAPSPSTKGRRARWIAAALACALGLGALAAWVRRPPHVRRAADLDVLLITIDTLPADALGCYGTAELETPWIDRLARGGVRFAQAHAPNVVTLPAHADILSGRYP